ncbi:MAG: hypothetical protein GXO77_06555 [Calditrichaeota bacterium]|nr:hypothetical protein [Calditrichota bacterium]
MIDKINQLGGLNNEQNKAAKIEKKTKIKKSIYKDVKQPQTASEVKPEKSDTVNISKSARELLKLRAEAERYLKLVQEKPTLNPEEVEELRNKVQNDFYLKDDVIDKIVNKLLSMINPSGKID